MLESIKITNKEKRISIIFFMNQYLMLFFSLFFGIVCSRIAIKKSRNKHVWFLNGILFGLIGFLIIFFIKPVKIIQKNISKIEIKDDNFWYFIDTEEKQIGPISLNKLFDNFQKGLISENTLVWNDTLIDWKKLKDIPIISNLLNKSTN